MRLNSHSHTTRLYQLTHIHIVFIVLWHLIIPFHIQVNKFISSMMLLVGPHPLCIDLNFFGMIDEFHRIHTWKGLKSKFTHKARDKVFKMLKRITIMPHPPVMCVTFKLIFWISTSILWGTFPIVKLGVFCDFCW